MDKIEIWKEHECGLFVSNLGRVRFPYKLIKFGENYTTYGSKNKRGYSVVLFKKHLYKVHRLVAQCFIPNPHNLPEVDHIIPVSQGGTNEVTNLRWITRKGNCNNENTIEYKKTHATNGKPKPILVYKNDNFFNEYPSIGECARQLNLQSTLISQNLHNIRESYKGYTFEFKYKKDKL